jgi:hypothetical protein
MAIYIIIDRYLNGQWLYMIKYDWWPFKIAMWSYLIFVDRLLQAPTGMVKSAMNSIVHWCWWIKQAFEITSQYPNRNPKDLYMLSGSLLGYWGCLEDWAYIDQASPELDGKHGYKNPLEGSPGQRIAVETTPNIPKYGHFMPQNLSVCWWNLPILLILQTMTWPTLGTCRSSIDL